MTHFTALQLGHALLKMFKSGQKKTLYEVSNFIKRHPNTIIQKVTSYIKKQPQVQPQQESEPNSESHENLGGYQPVLTNDQKELLHRDYKSKSEKDVRRTIDEMKAINEWIRTRDAKLLQINYSAPCYVKKCYPKLDQVIEKFNKMNHKPDPNQVFFQNQELQQLCSEMIMERNSEIKSHLSNLAKMRKSHLQELTLSMTQLQSRMKFIENQWAELSQQSVSILELSSSIQRRNEIICQAYIKRRDVELSQNNGDILIEKIYNRFDQKVEDVQKAINSLIFSINNPGKKYQYFDAFQELR